MEHFSNLKTILIDYLSNKPDAIIPRGVFAMLPREVVLEYANYYEIPNPDLLTSNQICDRLYSRGSELRALKRDAQYPTRTKFVVPQNVKNLVAQLAEHQSINLDASSSRNVFVSAVLHPHKDVKTQLFDVLMKLLAGCAGVEVANLVAAVASSFGRKYLGPRDLSLKRTREDEDEAEASGSRKRARQLGRDSNSEHALADGQVLWVDYVYDESDESDSSYIPGSSEDDDADMTLEEREEVRVYNRFHCGDLGDISGDLSSEGETEMDPSNQIPLRWKDYPSEDESDSDDPDYVPPRYTFENVLEIVTKRDYSFRKETYYGEMDRMRYMDELVDRGPLSEAGISSSDSNNSGSDSGEHFYHMNTLRRTFATYRWYIPQHLKRYSSLPAYLEYPFYRRTSDDPMEDRRKIDDNWYRQYARRLCEKASQKKGEPGWEICDIDARLETVLTGDHLKYAFDDWEWKGFADPCRSPTPTQ